MAWSNETKAIAQVMSLPLPRDEVNATSLGSILDSSAGLLRIFGIQQGNLAPPFGSATIPTSVGAVPQGNGEQVGFLEFVADPNVSAVLEIDESVSPNPIVWTCIPAQKEVPTHLPSLSLMTVASVTAYQAWVVYKDAHVLRLPDGRYLMLLMRAASRTDIFPGATPAGPNSSTTSIVGYIAPASDPSFTGTDIVGPLWLVPALHDVDVAGVVTALPLWTGTPAAVVDAAGTYLYLYYTAEFQSYRSPYPEAPTPSGFVPHVRVRRISLAWLCSVAERAGEATQGNMGWWQAEVNPNAAAGYVGSMSSSVIVPSPVAGTATPGPLVGGTDPAGYIQEELWDQYPMRYLVTGTDLGPVRIWVADGAPWVPGCARDLATLGNRLITARYEMLKTVDAVPVLVGGQLVLFFAANYWDQGVAAGEQGYGIWRASGFDSDAASGLEFGVDFVVADFVPDGSSLSGRDLVTSAEANQSPITAPTTYYYLDPDPVLWYGEVDVLLLFGRSDLPPPAIPSPESYLRRIQNDAASVATFPQDAW